MKKERSSWNKGIHYITSGSFKKGQVSPRKGIKLSEEIKKKISENRKGKPAWNKGTKNPSIAGEKHFNWKGGISHGYRKGYNNDFKYKQWHSDVFQRDNWTCQTCGIRGAKLQSHHIKSWAKYPKLRYEISNGVTLCLECHKLTDNFGGKK